MKSKFSIRVLLLCLFTTLIICGTGMVSAKADDENPDIAAVGNETGAPEEESQNTDTPENEVPGNNVPEGDFPETVSDSAIITETEQNDELQVVTGDAIDIIPEGDDEDDEEALEENVEDDEDEEDEDTEETDVKEKKKAKKTYSAADLRYLASIIYCEAGNHSYKGKVAVANVVLNRKNDTKNWGHVDTIKKVIYDKKWGIQFSPAYSSKNSMKAAVSVYKNLEDYKGTWRYDTMKSCIKAAKAALKGKTVVPDDYFYFNARIDSSKTKCKSKGWEYRIIDNHIYF